MIIVKCDACGEESEAKEFGDHEDFFRTKNNLYHACSLTCCRTIAPEADWIDLEFTVCAFVVASGAGVL